jgi:hypothetical protein
MQKEPPISTHGHLDMRHIKKGGHVELQRKLQENMDRIEAAGRGIPETMPLYLIGGNGNDNNRSTNYKSRTASMTREQQDERERRKQMIQRDVIQLFDEGYTVDQVAYFLEGHVSPSGKVSDLFPKEDVMNLAGMTDKAIFHRAGKTVVKNSNNGEYEDIEGLLKEYDSRIEDVEAELAETRDTVTKSALKANKQAIEQEKADLKKNVMKLIDLSHRILLYLDTPRSGLINTLMSRLAHDSYETEYEYADSTANGIKTKSNVLRGWPAFFYAQALDTSHYKRDAEANRRFIKINPNMAKEKYKAAARLIAEKWGTPDFMYQATVVSDAEKDKARQIIREIRVNLLSISGAIKPGRNNVIVPFTTAIIDALNTDDAQDMNTTQRLFTWLSLLPIVKLEKRPRIIIRRKGEIIREVMPLALFEDLKEAMFLMEYTSGVRPYISNWFDAVFLKILNAKTEVDKKTVDGFEKSEDRVALTTEQLVIGAKEIQGKTLTAQQVYETYLQPLMIIDSKRSNINHRNLIYWPTLLGAKLLGRPLFRSKNDQRSRNQGPKS